MYTNHRRLYHGFYYISYCGLSTPSLLLSAMEFISSLEKIYVLAKDKTLGPLRCHICKKALALSCDKVKIHYSLVHDIKVSATIGYPDPPARPVPVGGDSTAALSSPGIDGFLSGDHQPAMDMDTAAADYTPEDCTLGDDPVEPDDEPADSWDLDTVYSDFSDGVLENGPEDQVVPSSFTLPSSAIPPTDNQDENSISPLDSHDSPSRLAYGSGSRCFSASGFPGTHYLLI